MNGLLDICILDVSLQIFESREMYLTSVAGRSVSDLVRLHLAYRVPLRPGPAAFHRKAHWRLLLQRCHLELSQ